MDEVNSIWIEKYRPKCLDEVLGNDAIISRLKAYVEQANIPNMLFSGNAGVGKTASAHALARELFGDDFEANFTELNASDERGIAVVRDKIKKIALTNPLGEHLFKIIFLDECDALTSDAQAALRRTMERFTYNCRFILSCNYSSKIIAPIHSRCMQFRFSNLSNSDIVKQLNIISSSENLRIDDDAMNLVVDIAEGDMRRAVNLLQACSIGNSVITEEVIYSIHKIIDKEVVKKIVDFVCVGKFTEARSELDFLLFEQGFSGEDVIDSIFKYLVDYKAIPDNILIKMLEYVGEIDFRLNEGSNARIQLSALLAYFAKVVGDI